MPTLLDTQRHFTAAMLMAQGDALEPWLVDDAIRGAERLAIYRNSFTGVIVNALRLTYPVVERLVGAEFFEGAARMFLAAQPPRSACLNDYGAGFDGFLAELQQAAGLPYLPDVARLEWAVAQSTTADDASSLDPAALMQFRPEELGTLRLTPHPSLRVIALATPADTIWCAIREGNEDALPQIRIAGPAFALLVYRGPDGIVFRRLTTTEQAMTAALCAGVTLCEAMAAAPEAEATTLLAEHLSAGRFTRAEPTHGELA